MSLISSQFYIFAAIVVLLYYVLPKRCQWLTLLTASIVFYCSYGVEKLPFILISAAIAYVAGKKMETVRRESTDTAQGKRRCKRILLTAVTALVALLLYAKVGTWVIQSVARLFTVDGTALEAIVALGVSYYTFSLISYLADLYRKQDHAEESFPRLLLFTIYFPKVLQGPISRHKSLAPQLREEHAFDYHELCFGLQLMVWGYFKKLVIADRLLILINTVYGKPYDYPASILLVAAAFSCIQAYCDFSGCMDIVGGFSQILGLRLESNFDHPLFSRSAPEFWRRWHITLGTWFKDYVYMPLMISPRLIGVSKRIRDRFGARAGKAFMTVVPLTSVWLLTGFWHGTGLDYMAWGLYWGAIIICSTVFAPEIKRITKLLHINTGTKSWAVFQTVRTFALFTGGRLLTLPGNLRVTLSVCHKILIDFGIGRLFDGTLYTLGLNRDNFNLAVVCMLILLGVSIMQTHGGVRERIAACNIVFRWAIYYIAVLAVIIFGIYGPGFNAASFVYMKF